MPTSALNNDASFESGTSHAVIELTTRNHPGVMPQICGLLARRAFDMEAILCTPSGESGLNRIRLLVRRNHRLDQVIKQIAKLEDILELRHRDTDRDVFLRLDEQCERELLSGGQW